MARPRLSERAAYTPEALAAVAMRVFEARGYEATRMEHIANAANISKSSLYHHVSGKEELLRIALVRATASMFAHFERPEANEGPAIERLLFVVRQTVLNDLAFLSEAKVLLGPLAPESPIAEYVLAVRREFVERVERLVAAAQADGAFDGHVPSGLLTRLMLGMVHAPVDWYRPDGTWSANGIADMTVALIANWVPHLATA